MRYEYKYLVPAHRLADLREMLMPFVEMDPFSAARPTKAYTVRSIYFDTSGFDCYYEKEAGLKSRKKLRVRGYNCYSTGDPAFLEIKAKENMLITKHRSMVPYRDVTTLFDTFDTHEFLRERGASAETSAEVGRFFYHLNRRVMKPTALVTYEREAFLCRFDSTLRITLDCNLRGKLYPALDALYQNRFDVHPWEGHFVLEVKFASHRGFPFWLKQLIADFRLKKQALSKYATCVEAYDTMPGSPGLRLPAPAMFMPVSQRY